MTNIHTKSLLQFCGDDFELYESIEHTITYYKISVEGYMGFETVIQIVDLYKEFLVKLEEYLTENHEKTDKHIWECVYQTRAININYKAKCYWVFLDLFKTTQIWDTYYYMEDVIKQIIEFESAMWIDL